ncbi:MAG: DNA ligase [Undibacterium sp.]|nr:DNA ligase [Undibacterium sp.]
MPLLNPPLGLAHQVSQENTSQAATSLPLLLAQNYTDKFDPNDYLVSEKLDGVRAYWDGVTLRFKSGRIIHAPTWFTADFPDIALDGELWMGRQSFERLSAAVRRQEANQNEWKLIRYRLYEAPQQPGTFALRIKLLNTYIERLAIPWLDVLPQQSVKDKADLLARLNTVVKAGGEGIMLHRSDALFVSGRSESLLKLKPQLDAEAQVVAYQPGRGKYLGKMGALIVMNAQGQRFKLGSGFSDEQRAAPPAIGSFVSYRYRDLLSNGLPKFASYLRVREME